MSFVGIRITTSTLACGCALLTIATILGCGASQAEKTTAQNAGYNAEFAIVYGEALKVVRKYYPHYNENAGAGIIKTAWHPVRLSTTQSAPASAQPASQPIRPFSSNALPYKQHFVRFNIHIVGGDPWRVRVVGEASEWDASGVPVPLEGATEPHWLKGRRDALEVAIYRRLRKYAVPLKSTAYDKEAKQGDPHAVALDARHLSGLPKAAAAVIARVAKAAKARDFKTMRASMHPDFVWSLGAPPSAEQAIVLWQADVSLLAHLVAIIEAGCVASLDKPQVTCPPAHTQEPDYAGFRVGFEPGADGAWSMVFFVSNN